MIAKFDIASDLRGRLPEVWLIGLLLLLWGISGSLRDLVAVKTLLDFLQSRPDFALDVGAQLSRIIKTSADAILQLAGAVVGIGLLTMAPWARRAGVGVLGVFFVVGLIVLPVFPPRLGEVSGWWLTGYYLPHALHYLRYGLMIPFLESTRVRQAWEDHRRPGRLAEVAELLFAATRSLQPIHCLFALLFLLRGASAVQRGAQLLWGVVHGASVVGTLRVLWVVDISIGGLFLVAGIVFFRQTRWGCRLGGVALTLQMIATLLPGVLPSTAAAMWRFPDVRSIIVAGITLIALIGVYIVEVTLLLRSAPPPLARATAAAPPSVRGESNALERH